MQKTEKLGIAVSITSLIFILELAGGFFTNSVALLGDAFHMLTDVLALLLSISALLLARKKPDLRRTFGLHRVEIFAALVNGITVFMLAVFLLVESYRRLFHTENVRSLEMMLVAIVGLVANAVSLKILGHTDDLNVRSAALHILGDMLSSVVVVTGGFLMFFTGAMIIDPLLSIGISIVIMYSAFQILRESSGILMERAPKHLDVKKLVEEIRNQYGIVDVHDIRVWSICSNVHAMSAHLVVPDMKVSETKEIIKKVNVYLEKYGILITTFQIECENCGKGMVCEIAHCGSKEIGEH
ncbi:MAG: cation diffusion facilitator family transporter [Thermoplasmata archaeon]